jgi:hypothetical protein
MTGMEWSTINEWNVSWISEKPVKISNEKCVL